MYTSALTVVMVRMVSAKARLFNANQVEAINLPHYLSHNNNAMEKLNHRNPSTRDTRRLKMWNVGWATTLIYLCAFRVG